VGQVKKTVDALRECLGLEEATRFSCRALYVREFPTFREANEELLKYGLVPWPKIKVFDQPERGEKNAFDLTYRFEDEKSFTTLRIRTEQLILELRLDPAFKTTDDLEKKQNRNRVVVEFDRGVLGTVSLATLRVDDWFKGFQHLLRRDIDSVFGSPK
jgi:hypothetical protein